MYRRVRPFLVGVALTSSLGGCGSPKPSASPASLLPSTAPVAVVTPPPKRLRVEPASATLSSDDFGMQLVAIPGTVGDSGVGLSEPGTWTAEPAGVVEVDDGYVRAVGPGRALVRVSARGEAAEATIEVVAATDRPWDAAEDIVPILTRAGCNTGGCHGRADGQNGFHLSLFGYDAAGDFGGITRQDGGRRYSAIDPESSLFLKKATGAVPHVGGPRIAVGSPDYQVLLAWIRAGSPLSRGKTHGSMTGLRVEPAEVRLDGPGLRQLRVLAKYADGHERDVTRQAIYKTNDDSAATVDPKGRATLLRRSEADLIVRYGSQVVATRVGTVINPGLSYDFAARARKNFIDDALFRRLEALRVPPSPPASDAAFLRRITLDLTGEQPRPEQVREFLADKGEDKRARLVDRLLKERDFVRFWSIKLGDLLEITTARPEIAQTSALYQGWVTARLAENMPWDKFATALVTALGDPSTREDAASSYALEAPDPKILAEKTAQRFLGLRLRCAQCHDHPFDVWTQDDYFGLAATFAKVDRSDGMMAGAGMMGKTRVRINPAGTLEHLRTRKPAEARLLSHQAVVTKDGDDPRKALAAWMTAPDNPFFARAMANWVWSQFFARGIVDPPDDLSRSNPPVHPELLDALARHFVEHKFDLRDLIRTIVASEAYGMSSATVPGNEADVRLFSHQLPRPLTAHQMADALAQVTDVVNRFPNKFTGMRAIEVNDPATPSTILDTFGRCSRLSGCASVQTPALSLRQALLLIGGDVIEGKVAHPNGYLANLLELKPTPDEVVENFYLRALCRAPTEEELSRWSAELKGSGSFREAAEDLLWALLNSREFAFNH